MNIVTKWGKLVVDPNKVYEVNVRLNPWDNIYTVEFIMEGSYERLNAEVGSAKELSALVNRIATEMSIIRQYKYKDSNGRMQINEKRRLALMRELESDR